MISLSKPSQFWLCEINFFILFWVCEQTDVWKNQDQPHTHSCYIGSREFLSKQKSHKHRRSICGSAARLVSAAPSANVPSLGAVVLDLLPAFLQRLDEDVQVFVGFNPNQLFWEVDLKRFHWWDKQQLFYKKTPGVRSHSIKLMTFTKAQRPKTKTIILVQSLQMIGLFIHVCLIVHVDFDQDPLIKPRQWDWCERGSVCAHFKESAKWNFLNDRKAPQHQVMRTLTPAFNHHKPFTVESLKFFYYYLHSGWILLKVNDPHRFNKIFCHIFLHLEWDFCSSLLMLHRISPLLVHVKSNILYLKHTVLY